MNSTRSSILRAFIEAQFEVDALERNISSVLDHVTDDCEEGDSASQLIVLVLDAINAASAGGFARWTSQRRRDWLETWLASVGKPVRDLVWLLTSAICLQRFSAVSGRKSVWPTEGEESPNCVAPAEAEQEHQPIDLARKFAVCIIGSGAGGAVVAQRLAEAGIEPVLIVEAGKWLNPGDFPFHDDATALRRAYVARGVNPALSKPIPIQDFLKTGRVGMINVLQGLVVGGGPAVNNAICLRMPEPTVGSGPWSEWLDARVPFAYGDLANAYCAIEKDLRPSEAPVDRLAGWRSSILKTITNGENWRTLDINVVRDCLACGGCNTGCRYGKKKGGLHPWRPDEPNSHLMHALRHRPHSVKVLARHRAEKFLIEGGRVVSVLLSDLNANRTVRVEANAFVLAAGPFASTVVLGNTKLPTPLPSLGKRFSCNIVTPVYGVFPQKPPDCKDPRLGLQMCYYFVDEKGGLLRESWFAFPGAISATLPGALPTRREILKHYERLGCIGVVVPSGPHGRVLRDPNRIVIGPKPDELSRLKRGTVNAAKTLIDAGAISVCLASKELIQAGTAADFECLVRRKIRSAADLNLGTAHPQGGNAISDDPKLGVVDRQFQVRGVPGLFVADASLFPAGCGVNPMLTTMALASMAASAIVEYL